MEGAAFRLVMLRYPVWICLTASGAGSWRIWYRLHCWPRGCTDHDHLSSAFDHGLSVLCETCGKVGPGSPPHLLPFSPFSLSSHFTSWVTELCPSTARVIPLVGNVFPSAGILGAGNKFVWDSSREQNSFESFKDLLTLPGKSVYNKSWCSSYTLRKILLYSLCTVMQPAFTLFAATYTHEIRAAGMFSRSWSLLTTLGKPDAGQSQPQQMHSIVKNKTPASRYSETTPSWKGCTLIMVDRKVSFYEWVMPQLCLNLV